jgi:hypothetical protein
MGKSDRIDQEDGNNDRGLDLKNRKAGTFIVPLGDIICPPAVGQLADQGFRDRDSLICSAVYLATNPAK